MPARDDVGIVPYGEERTATELVGVDAHINPTAKRQTVRNADMLQTR